MRGCLNLLQFVSRCSLAKNVLSESIGQSALFLSMDQCSSGFRMWWQVGTKLLVFSRPGIKTKLKWDLNQLVDCWKINWIDGKICNFHNFPALYLRFSYQLLIPLQVAPGNIEYWTSILPNTPQFYWILLGGLSSIELTQFNIELTLCSLEPTLSSINWTHRCSIEILLYWT